MRKILIVLITLLLSSCTNKTDQLTNLTKVIDNLRKDSIEMAHENKLLTSKLDSIQNSSRLLDSIRNNKDCKYNKYLISLSEKVKGFRGGSTSFQDLKDGYEDLRDMLGNMSPAMQTDAQNIVNTFEEHEYDISRYIPGFSSSLWLAVYQEQIRRVSQKYCK